MTEATDDILNTLLQPASGEPAASFSGFCIFARTPAKDRTPLDKIIPQIAKEIGLTASTVKVYAVQNKWIDRASMIEAYLLKLDIQERQKENRKLTLQFIETNRIVKTKVMEAVAGSADVVLVALDRLQSDDTKFKPTDLASVIKAMRDGIALVNEIPTEIVNNRPVADKDINTVQSLQELEEIERALDAELQEIAAESVN